MNHFLCGQENLARFKAALDGKTLPEKFGAATSRVAQSDELQAEDADTDANGIAAVGNNTVIMIGNVVSIYGNDFNQTVAAQQKVKVRKYRLKQSKSIKEKVCSMRYVQMQNYIQFKNR